MLIFPAHVEITKQPSNREIPPTTEDIEDDHYYLTCNATSYDPTRQITWLRNGVSVQSMAPPGGFTYFANPGHARRNPGFDDAYQCLVWGVEPPVSLLSQPAGYIVKGHLTLNYITHKVNVVPLYPLLCSAKPKCCICLLVK